MDTIHPAKPFGFSFITPTPNNQSHPLSRWISFARRANTLLALFAVLFNCCNLSSAAAVLTHRFTFDIDGRDEMAVPKATISSAKIENGAVVFRGGDTVIFPRGIFDSHTNSSGVGVVATNLTVELWISIDADVVGINNDALYLGSLEARFRQSAFTASAAFRELSCPLLPAARTNHVVWTQDATARTTKLYIDGELVSKKSGVSPVAVAGANNYLSNGKAFRGKVFEFRVYQGVLIEMEVAMSNAAGPDNPSPAPGELLAIKINAPAAVGHGSMTRYKVLADFENLTNVNISTLPGLSVSSLNPGVIEPVLVPNEVGGTSFMTAVRKLKSYELGVGQLTAEFQGKTTQSTVMVAGVTNATLVNRLSFNEPGWPSTSTVAYDSVGSAHGFMSSSARSTGTGQLQFNSSWVTLPAGILSGLGEVSVEAWVGKPVYVSANQWGWWSRIFDFGDQLNGYGKSYIFLSPAPSLLATVCDGYAETPLLDLGKKLPTNVMSHLTMTYSPRLKVSSLYVDGELVASDIPTHPLAMINDVRNFLGASQYGRDPLFSGSFEEFRIFNGVLLDSQVAANFQAGPNTIPTAPQDALEYSLLPPEPLGVGLVNFRVLANPNSKSTTMYFEYGPTASYGKTTEELDLGMGLERKLYTSEVSDLPQAASVEQHVRAVFIRDGQTNYSADLIYLSPRPVRLEQVVNVGTTTATFRGLVAPNGVPTTLRPNSDHADPIVVSGGADYIPFSITLTNLLPATSYSYSRVVAITATTTNYSYPPIGFTTLPVPRIENFMRTNNQVQVQFNSQSGPSYQLYGSSDLTNWTHLTNGIALTTGTNTLTGYDPIEPPRFYKLEGR